MATYDLKDSDRLLVNISEKDSGEYLTHQVSLADVGEIILQNNVSGATILRYRQNDFNEPDDSKIPALLNEGEFTSNRLAGGDDYNRMDTFIFHEDADLGFLRVGEELLLRNVSKGHSAVYTVTAIVGKVIDVDYVSQTVFNAPGTDIVDRDQLTIELVRKVYPTNLLQTGSNETLMERVNIDMDNLTELPL